MALRKALLVAEIAFVDGCKNADEIAVNAVVCDGRIESKKRDMNQKLLSQCTTQLTVHTRRSSSSDKCSAAIEIS
jgi:hypothetical protein